MTPYTKKPALYSQSKFMAYFGGLRAGARTSKAAISDMARPDNVYLPDPRIDNEYETRQ